ncbi:MAG TPA: alpha/beta hydrolase [Cytophagales bacterium]|nr:alpha/beta hydrolase [Cytophagales bacterium]
MKIYFYLFILWVCTGCLRLDDNLFNKKQLGAYALEQYDGEQDFKLDGSYAIAADKITLFTLKSQLPEESKATMLRAVYIGDTAKIKTDTVILYCHGNKWHMDFYWQRAKLLAHAGGKHRYGVLMLDYRGYGMSEGKSTEKSLYHDVDVAMQWLKARGLRDERLIGYGFSLGAFPLCELSAQPRSMRPSALIFEAPYANASAMVADASGIALPSSYVTNLEIDNAEKIKNVYQPLLWIHGSEDHYCKLETQGQVVFDHHPGAKESFIIPGADHDNVPLLAGFESYLTRLASFIQNPH